MRKSLFSPLTTTTPPTNNTHELKEVVLNVFEQFDLQRKLQETHILNCWDQLVGEAIAQKTEQMFIRQGKLYLKISSAVVRQEIFYAKTEIIKALNAAADETIIEDLVLLG